MIFTSELSKSEAQALFQAPIEALRGNAAAYAIRSGVQLPEQNADVAERVLAAAGPTS